MKKLAISFLLLVFLTSCYSTQPERNEQKIRRILWTVEKIETLTSPDRGKIYVITWINSHRARLREEVFNISWEKEGAQIIGFENIRF